NSKNGKDALNLPFRLPVTPILRFILSPFPSKIRFLDSPAIWIICIGIFWSKKRFFVIFLLSHGDLQRKKRHFHMGNDAHRIAPNHPSSRKPAALAPGLLYAVKRRPTVINVSKRARKNWT